MRVMSLLDEFNSEGEPLRAPEVMLSKEAFDEWLGEFTRTALPATVWLSTDVKRELYLIQDYLVTVGTNLAGAPSDRFAVVGSFIREDFIDLSNSLEKKAFRYFGAQATRMRLNDLTEHHKYSPEESDRRLKNLAFNARFPRVMALIQAAGHDNPDESNAKTR
jgi:hypothetical protein